MKSAILAILTAAALATPGAYAQGRGGPPRSPKAAAPFDITGYWVSLVTEDWRWRMVTPAKGDDSGVPVNAEAKKVAAAWDAAKDEAAGEQCKSYGAASIMRVPGRFHFTWQDDNTLKVDVDAGTQSRLYHFGPAPKTPGTPSLQGYSAAKWDHQAGGFGPPPPGGALKVVTTDLKAGYLRKNGIPYSANAVVTEYYDVVKEPDGEEFLIIKTLIEDPQYLNGLFMTSTHFKREPDASKWHPTACTAR